MDRLSDDNERLERHLEWALCELKSNDEKNREIATEIAKKHRIRVRFVATEWGRMP